MDLDRSRLDAALRDADVDGYCVYAAGDDATQRYLSGFDAPDPYLTCYGPAGLAILVSGLEYGRATKEARAETVARHSAYDYHDRVDEHGRRVGRAKTARAFLADQGVDSVLVPDEFPLGTAEALRAEGVDVEVDEDDVVADLRAVKSDEEIEHIRTAQVANERALRRAEELIAGADVVDGVLHHDGEPLTSERVATEIEIALLEEGCALDETIVACGADAADPHDRGSGPLRADESIVVDVFPRDKVSGYHADMTRTFVKGEPSATLREWFELTDRAKQAALEALEAGVTGAEVHGAACDVYEEAGLPTLRADSSAETGFIHSTGHGIGLEVHEGPGVNDRNDDPLEPGNVVTIEPGLYDPEVGGVRIEDLVVVTEDGYENLTDYPAELVV